MSFAFVLLILLHCDAHEELNNAIDTTKEIIVRYFIAKGFCN